MPGETPKTVQNLSFWDRLSLGFNTTDVVLLTPNISAEYILGNRNYSRWTIGMTYKNKWDTHHTYLPGFEFRRNEIRGEIRNYWRNIDLSNPDFDRLPKHRSMLGRLLSQRKKHVKHPNTVFYRGVYASYGTYSYLFSSTGRQGKIAQAGVLGGIIKPLYVYPSGHTVCLDLGLSVGAAMVNADKFKHDREDNCYPYLGHNPKHFLPYPFVSDIHVGLVFRMGKKTLPELYRRRYEVDDNFHEAMDSINDLRRKQRMDRHFADSLYNMVLNEFEHLYDSINKAQKNMPVQTPVYKSSNKNKTRKKTIIEKGKTKKTRNANNSQAKAEDKKKKGKDEK